MSSMTLLEVNALLLLMKHQREELVQFGKKHREQVWSEENSMRYWDMRNALDTQRETIEIAMPEFRVEYMEEANEYCLVPMRTLPYRSCRAIVVFGPAMEVVR